MTPEHHDAAWQRIGAADATGPVTLHTACRTCVEDLDADFGGATLVTAGELRVLGCATDERARAVEDAQLVTGEGPCTDAYVHRRPVDADLHQAGERWPVFTPAACETGARRVLALPLAIGNLLIGAVDLYRCTPTPFTAAHKDRAAAYARILALLALDEHPHLITGPTRPAQRGPQGYPPTVHMAAGVLAAKDNLTPDDALARLRAHSFRHNQPLLRTAEHVLDHHRLD
ncbi:ANTAR domain-containing protein [Streptomyces albofaciens JCM 4342]|uniref:GAF and ANTAR domain-containing protein n=1 Tax=Streptomyces albofaciens TaxID=66866 RepID=UPI00123C4740|nr:GAF and ANTAR domain-containing protein [Streptomyces albofaciens]KAA6215024.1 ANTAR domain-containing protein [Streptomyces albofaciens JCM 4342]